jgi:hypothetical protein
MIADVESELMTAYVTALSSIIPCYDGLAEETQSLPYAIITLSGVDSDSADSNKDQLVYSDVKASVEIFTNYKGQKQCNEIGNQILNAILDNSQSVSFALPSFNVVKSSYSTQPYGRASIKTMKTPTGYLSRKFIEFTHIISQKI